MLASLALQAQQFATDVVVGAEQFVDTIYAQYQNKRIGLLVNQTSIAHNEHLVDQLHEKGLKLETIFAPEHGFRGDADAGAHVKNGKDTKTGLPIISLYGKNKKPTKDQLANVDVIIFDIQDVGTRFYTYISTLQYMMEACAEHDKELIVLDRPNPNGFYVDGPVLEKEYTSFVGMQSIPVVHGMTVGEYANMLNGEGWLANKRKVNLKVIPCKNYSHNMLYKLPVAPSPNLRTFQAVLLYPSLCFFEGTEVSVGRGTETPFEVWGHPDYKHEKFTFKPLSSYGSAKPLYMGQVCYGENLHAPVSEILQQMNGQLRLEYVQKAYYASNNQADFFNTFFEKLAGTASLRKQIVANKTTQEIRASWEPALTAFKAIRKKYLLYEDF